MSRVSLIAEQYTIDGTVEYVVYYDDGSVQMFKDYPTDDDLLDPAARGRKVT